MAAPRHGRRALLAGFGALPVAALGGCGFTPVYGTRSATGTNAARDGLAAIAVEIIPERSGQLLRQALQERCERFGAGAERRYTLQASFSVADEGIAIQQDSAVTRIRMTGYAQYTLRGLDSSRRTLTSGTARALDGLDVINQQFFAGDLEHEQIVRRLAEACADQIALQLANYFDSHPTA